MIIIFTKLKINIFLISHLKLVAVLYRYQFSKNSSTAYWRTLLDSNLTFVANDKDLQ